MLSEVMPIAMFEERYVSYSIWKQKMMLFRGRLAKPK